MSEQPITQSAIEKAIAITLMVIEDASVDAFGFEVEHLKDSMSVEAQLPMHCLKETYGIKVLDTVSVHDAGATILQKLSALHEKKFLIRCQATDDDPPMIEIFVKGVEKITSDCVEQKEEEE